MWVVYIDLSISIFFFFMWFVAYSSCEWCVWWNICGFSLKVSIKHQLIIHHFIENGRKSRSSAFNHNCAHASQFGSIQTLFFNSPKKYRTKAITFFVCASSEMSVCVINFCSPFFLVGNTSTKQIVRDIITFQEEWTRVYKVRNPSQIFFKLFHLTVRLHEMLRNQISFWLCSTWRFL